MSAIYELSRKFVSGNDVPVEFARFSPDEWAQVVAERDQLRKALTKTSEYAHQLDNENCALRVGIHNLRAAADKIEQERDQSRAMVAELESKDINAIANRVCGDIPEDFVMQLYMENGYGGIELFHKGERVEIDMADWKIHEQVNVAFQCIAQIFEEQGNG